MENTKENEAKTMSKDEQNQLTGEVKLLKRMADKFKATKLGMLLSFLFGSGIYCSIYFPFRSSKDTLPLSFYVLTISTGLLIMIIYNILFWLIRDDTETRLSIAESKLPTNDLQKLVESKTQENFFAQLVGINFKYLDKYYQQTQVQANKSFRLCLFAAVFSLLVIVAGIVLMFISPYDKNLTSGDSSKLSSYIVTASGVLSEFIAAVFFYLYNQTILKMSEYHQKLVLTQNISLALKISEGLKDPAVQSKSQKFLIKELTKDVNFHLMNNGGLNKTITKKEEGRSSNSKLDKEV